MEIYGNIWNKYVVFLWKYMDLQEDFDGKYYEISGDTLGGMTVKCI